MSNNDSFIEVKEIDWPGSNPPVNIPVCGSYICPPGVDNGELKIKHLWFSFHKIKYLQVTTT